MGEFAGRSRVMPHIAGFRISQPCRRPNELKWEIAYILSIASHRP